MSWRSEQHLNRVRALRCCFCFAPGPSDAHHFAGSRGTALKASDSHTVPLCRGCHDHLHRTSSFPGLTRKESFSLMWEECARILSRVVEGE